MEQLEQARDRIGRLAAPYQVSWSLLGPDDCMTVSYGDGIHYLDIRVAPEDYQLSDVEFYNRIMRPAKACLERSVTVRAANG